MRSTTTRVAAFAACVLLSACGGGQREEASPQPSRGQVAATAAYKVSHYAAARFAEQATFGATPALIEELRTKGFAKWIDEQFALPPSQIDTKPFQRFVDPAPRSEWLAYNRAFPDFAVGAADQLRLRVVWTISQFIVASSRKGDLVGTVYWFNMLSRQAFGLYDELLYQVSVSPTMAHYLDNDQNRPKSDECPWCAPNENYARELLQLFSLGVFKLAPDGTPLKDSRGRLIETYSQKDVEELARTLTGWQHDPLPEGRPNRNWGNWAKPMVPSTFLPERDRGAKTVLGKTFPAGQSQDKDLRDAIALLMSHQNIAPFVAVRMIQHHVKSNPSPAYVGRVAAAFRNNGKGVAGDMKAVVKAVLLDAEARAGDSPSTQRADDGKFREPFLHVTAMWRGLGCTKFPVNEWGPILSTQVPFNQESVFGFYTPYDRAPGSNLLAPEQRLLTSENIRNRLDISVWPSDWDPATGGRSYPRFAEAGCALEPWRTAFARSPLAYNDLLAATYFRGSMPPGLRSNIEQLMREPWPPWRREDTTEGALRMISFALATPYFGVSK